MSSSVIKLLKILAFLAAGLGLGYYSADYAMTRGIHSVSVSNGPWTTWPYVASPSADPYTRAHFASTGKLAVTSFEAITFRAENDSDGRVLSADCDYTVSGTPLAARWWSITVYDEDGRLMPNPAERYSFNSTEITRKPDGSFAIRLAREVQPGNWIPIGTTDSFRLLLRIYNADQRLSDNLAGADLPAVTRESCT